MQLKFSPLGGAFVPTQEKKKFFKSLLFINKNFENQENFINLVFKIEKRWLWRMRNLPVAGKTTVYYSCNIRNSSTPCISKGNSKFNYS